MYLFALGFYPILWYGFPNPIWRYYFMAVSENFQEIALDIIGMTWIGCEDSVVRALANLNGVQNVTASYAGRSATVVYDQTLVNLDVIATALLRGGFVGKPRSKNHFSDTGNIKKAETIQINEGDPLICYCFGYTRNDIRTDLITNGRSLIMERIMEEKKIGTCQCSTKNPTGKWCLGDVRQVVDEVKNTK